MGEQVAARIKEKKRELLWERKGPEENREETKGKSKEETGGLSSAGRAPALQAGGREFESLSLHSRRE